MSELTVKLDLILDWLRVLVHANGFKVSVSCMDGNHVRCRTPDCNCRCHGMRPAKNTPEPKEQK
jgi:hypothetical protein